MLQKKLAKAIHSTVHITVTAAGAELIGPVSCQVFKSSQLKYHAQLYLSLVTSQSWYALISLFSGRCNALDSCLGNSEVYIRNFKLALTSIQRLTLLVR